MHLKLILGKGLLLAVPLGVVLYVFIRLVIMLERLIDPLAMQFGIRRLLGEMTLTIFSILVLVLFVLFLGLLMQIPLVAGFGKKLETLVLTFFPSFNQLKLMASDKLDFETHSSAWTPVLLRYEGKYSPAYIIEETQDMITLFVMKGLALEDGELLITSKDDLSYKKIPPALLYKYTRQYGKGFLELIAGGNGEDRN